MNPLLLTALNYVSLVSLRPGLNRRPRLYQRRALPTELPRHFVGREGFEPPKPEGVRFTV